MQPASLLLLVNLFLKLWMFILDVGVPGSLVVESQSADGAQVGPGVGVRVLVLGEGKLCRKSLGAVVALKRFCAVLGVDAQDVDLALGVAREPLGAERTGEVQLLAVDKPCLLYTSDAADE